MKLPKRYELRIIHYSSIEEDARLTLDALLLFWTTIISIALYLSQPPLPYFLSGIWGISFICLGAAWVELWSWLRYLWKEVEEEVKKEVKDVLE